MPGLFENSILKEDFTQPRNSIIARIFRFLKLSENAGSGFRKMFNGWRSYYSIKPEVKNEIDYYKITFNMAVERCWKIFGDLAYEKRTRGQTSRRRRKNSTLFEVWTTSLVKITEEEMTILEQKKDELIKKHEDLVTDDNDYFRAITYSTQKKDHYRIRNEKVLNIIKETINA